MPRPKQTPDQKEECAKKNIDVKLSKLNCFQNDKIEPNATLQKASKDYRRLRYNEKIVEKLKEQRHEYRTSLYKFKK